MAIRLTRKKSLARLSAVLSFNNMGDAWHTTRSRNPFWTHSLLPMPSMPHCDDSSNSLDNTGAEYQDRCTGTGTGHPLLFKFHPFTATLQLYPLFPTLSRSAVLPTWNSYVSTSNIAVFEFVYCLCSRVPASPNTYDHASTTSNSSQL